METSSRGKRKRTANARMVNVIVAVAVFLLILALFNVLFLHSHMHSYSSSFDLVSRSVVRPVAQTNAAVSIQSLLETNNVMSLFHEDLQACSKLPRTACSDKTYTIIAACSGDSLPTIVQKVLQWMHDPFVHQIYLLFPSSVRTDLLQDHHYGARLLHWEDQHSIQLVYADSLATALHGVDVKTGAFVWVPNPDALLPNQRIREAFGQWKSDASRPFAVPKFTAHWFVLHRNWICFLRSMTRQASDNWDTSSSHQVFSLLAPAVSHEASPSSC